MNGDEKDMSSSPRVVRRSISTLTLSCEDAPRPLAAPEAEVGSPRRLLQVLLQVPTRLAAAKEPPARPATIARRHQERTIIQSAASRLCRETTPPRQQIAIARRPLVSFASKSHDTPSRNSRGGGPQVATDRLGQADHGSRRDRRQHSPVVRDSRPSIRTT